MTSTMSSAIQEIDEKIAKLQAARETLLQLDGGSVSSRPGIVARRTLPTPLKRRTMSPESREKIAAAQRARWAGMAKKKAPAKTKWPVAAAKKAAPSKKAAVKKKPAVSKLSAVPEVTETVAQGVPAEVTQ